MSTIRIYSIHCSFDTGIADIRIEQMDKPDIKISHDLTSAEYAEIQAIALRSFQNAQEANATAIANAQPLQLAPPIELKAEPIRQQDITDKWDDVPL